MISEKMNNYIDVLTGSAFIKSRKLEKGILEITYFNSYQEFKGMKSNTKITEGDYNNYFKTGNQTQKILVGEPARLLRKFPELTCVVMVLFNNKFFVERDNLNKLIGIDISSLSVEDTTWIENYANKYIVNKNGREQLFNQINKFSEDIFKIQANSDIKLNELLKWMNESIDKGELKITLDGSIVNVPSNEVSKEEKVRSKTIIYLVQGALRSIGDKAMSSLLESDIAHSIKEFFEGFLN
ncbi:hypothetical protein [Priestia megaterium]|uniref:hypothetical protein n=1 Tax=Priestia megaterium TaxID=1404 RepID=UPI001C2109FC|nr:hypothetical protein [Priestia megaterium]MBU8689509.1 hypothetical protein [Priestia megaterium]